MTEKTMIKKFNEMTDYFCGSEYYTKQDFENHKDDLKSYFVKEIKYWISCCYECGHALNDELRSGSREARKYLLRAKRFVATLSK